MVPVLGHLGVLAAAALALGLFLLPGKEHGGINSFDGARFEDMLKGTAPKPYVQRVLLPQTVRAVGLITPDRFELSAATWAESHGLVRGTFVTLGWATGAAYPYFVAALLMYLCFVGFGYACAGLARVGAETCRPGSASPLLATLALYGLTPFFIYGSPVYDPPQLLLFTSSLYFLARLAIVRFMLLFVAATLNKETALLLLPIFAVFCRPSLPRRQYVSVLSALCGIYLAVRVAIFTVFRDNPGALFESHLIDHSLVPRTWVKIYARTPYFALLLTAAVLFWNRRPRFLKIALLSTLPALVITAVLFGYVDEWRDYYEAYPIVFALAVDFFRRVS
jgi:hypothetical protein